MLTTFKSAYNLTWFLIGNFNDMLTFSRGGAPIRQATLVAFNNFVDSCELVDLGYNGPKYTWIKKGRYGTIILERLDWAFGSQDWRLIFNKAEVRHLPRTCSDHAPILVNLFPSRSTPGYAPFRLQPMWFTHNDFTKLVEDYWASSNENFSEDSLSFAHKATVWNREVYGNVHLKLCRICARIEGVQ
ncbi:hypothetical protein LIER_11773 [Lithospermum erythrorhizon]|uniref:Uncharacterized protein n=1 Tax=Lithospermum erythrorhizon TaxID=34254 RepID=A0AAV3PR92_LITER